MASHTSLNVTPGRGLDPGHVRTPRHICTFLVYGIHGSQGNGHLLLSFEPCINGKVSAGQYPLSYGPGSSTPVCPDRSSPADIDRS